MKKLYSILIILLFISISLNSKVIKKFGEEIKTKDTVKISVILENPEKFLNKTVKVEGIISDVCKRKGCWMDLASDKEFQTLKVKVKDGDMVFPLTFKGKFAVVEGKLYKLSYSKEQLIEQRKHQAEENGIKFDPTTVKEGITVYQFRPTGVVIKEKK